MNPNSLLSPLHSCAHLRHNHRRQEHPASLELDLAAKRILGAGAGIGDHTNFFLNHRSSSAITEARKENLAILQEGFAGQE